MDRARSGRRFFLAVALLALAVGWLYERQDDDADGMNWDLWQDDMEDLPEPPVTQDRAAKTPDALMGSTPGVSNTRPEV